eukprot:c13833_g1_i1.p1 GENE.c13833_g1_i1~~c13833_g1_i1.p1  ORF type:complete len:1081 (+),score=303.66 c13833_g1_i1:371-3244(+)
MGGVGRPVAWGPMNRLGRDKEDSSDFSWMLPSCDKIAWPAFERYKTILGLRQYTTFDPIGAQRIGLLVGRPGEIALEATEELVFGCIILQIKACRVISLLSQAGPVLPPSIGPEKTMEWISRAQTDGCAMEIVQNTLRFHDKQLLNFCLTRSVMGTHLESLHFGKAALNHAIDTLEYTAYVLANAKHDDYVANVYMLGEEEGLREAIVPTEDMTLHESHFSDHVVSFDPHDVRGVFHERVAASLKNNKKKRTEKLMEMGRVTQLFTNSLGEWESIWTHRLEQYSAVFLFWAIMFLTHPFKVFIPDCKLLIMLIYNIFSGLTPQKSGVVARLPALPLQAFLDELDDLMEPIESLEVVGYLFHRFEHKDYATINSIKQQEKNKFVDDFSAVLEDSWIVVSGSWVQMMGNFMCLSKRKNEVVWLGEKPEWEDMYIETKMTVMPGADHESYAGLILRCQNVGDRLKQGKCYLVTVNVVENKSTVVLHNEGQTTELASSPIQRPAAKSSAIARALQHQPFRLKVRIEGGALTVWFEGEEVIRVRDPAIVSKSGSIGFVASEAELKIDWIKVDLIPKVDHHDPDAMIPDAQETGAVTHRDVALMSARRPGSGIEASPRDLDQETALTLDGTGRGSVKKPSKSNKDDDAQTVPLTARNVESLLGGKNNNNKEDEEGAEGKAEASDSEDDLIDADKVSTVTFKSTEASLTTLTDSMAESEVDLLVEAKRMGAHEKEQSMEASHEAELQRLQEKEKLRLIQEERLTREQQRRERLKEQALKKMKRDKLMKRKLEEKHNRERQMMSASLESICRLIAPTCPALTPHLFIEIASAFTAYAEHLNRETRLLYMKVVVPFSKFVLLESKQVPTPPNTRSYDLYAIDGDFVLPPMLAFTAEISEAGMPSIMNTLWKNISMALPPHDSKAKPHNLAVIDQVIDTMTKNAPKNQQRAYQGVAWYFKSMATHVE